MRILGLVPARGGSKGIPRKNIRLLAGKPLLAYTAETALNARSLARVVLSTDDEEIAETGRRYGLEVPFVRPAELATDTTPTLPVVRHAIEALEATGDRFDAVCLLQPTNPLRQPRHIDEAVALLKQRGTTSVVSVLRVPAEHNPHWVYFQSPEGFLRLSTGEQTPIARRQELPPAFHREGSIYVTRRDTVMVDKTLYGANVVGYLMDADWSVNIDHEPDWERAAALVRRSAALVGGLPC
jgi:CMP-N-acetylneuraminic acid synthetase